METVEAALALGVLYQQQQQRQVEQNVEESGEP